MTHRRSALAAVVAALMVIGGVLLSAASFGLGSAQAHSFLEDSNPADGASITQSPGTVTLTFNEPVQTTFASMSVVGPGRSEWGNGDPVVTGKTVSIAVGTLGAAGDYTVNYRITSADGHVVSGSTRFTLTEDGGGTPVATTESTDESGVPAWPFIAGAVALVLAGLGWSFRPRRG